MADPQFFAQPKPASLEEIAAWCGGRLIVPEGHRVRITGLAPLDTAGPGDLSFLDNRRYLAAFEATKASACLVHPRFAARLPAGVAGIETADPYRAWATVLAKFYPAAFRPLPPCGTEVGTVAAGAHVHPAAVLEPGVTVEPGAVIGPRAEIGTGTVVCAGAVVGQEVRIGRNGYIGAGATLIHALLGNRVLIHAGARIGQDGFGFAMGPRGHLKVPQIGRVIIQDDVEIGAGTTIDRGAIRDTVIGEGTKIDNLVQIGHNVTIGRHCVIVAHVGIAGSVSIGDFVVLGGQVGIAGHLKIASGAQVAAQSGVTHDLAPGGRYGGTPARTTLQWARETAVLRRLARRARANGETDDEGREGSDR